MSEQIDHPENLEQPIEPIKSSFNIFPFFKKSQAAFVLIVLAIIFYSPSFNNEYALDDGIIIHQNEFVIKGVKGIPDIIDKDAYYSFYKRMNASDQLQGGRYRPIASISYAVEQEIIGPYRTGYYMRVEDSNRNGILDADKVHYTDYTGHPAYDYEYNDYVDSNNDKQAQPEECYNCWDLNKNFSNDPEEDLNADGVFNEVDCQVNGAWLRHLDNILLYALCCLLVYILFANHFFPRQQDLAFLAALIFTIHPVHSEVVANVRGRDDIFSIIFIALTFIFSFRYSQNKKYIDLFVAAFAFFLALMSKEYGLMLFVVLPLGLWIFADNKPKITDVLLPFVLTLVSVVLMVLFDIRHLYIMDNPILTYSLFALVYAILNLLIFQKDFRKQSGPELIALFGIATIAYLGFRLNAVNMAPGIPDTEILNNPYLLASQSQAFATKIYTMLIDLRLSLWPHPLVSDYSYNSITYKELTDPLFILSCIIYVTILFAGIVLSIRKHVVGFALLTYFVFLIIVSNLFFPTGLMMLESGLFHASLGTSIFLAWILVKVFNPSEATQNSNKRALAIAVTLIIVVLSGMICWERSKDWKNDVTLFFKDVHNAPNSVLVLGNAGARWIDLADTKEITGMRGGGSSVYNDYNGTLKISDEEVRQGGFADKREAALNRGIGYLQRAVELHPRYVNGFLNLGLAFFKLKKDKEAIIYWKLAERLYPNNPYLNNYYQVYTSMLNNNASEAFEKQDYKTALVEANKLTLVQPNNAEAWQLKAGICYNMGLKQQAKAYWMHVLELNSVSTDLRAKIDTILIKMYPKL